MQVPKMQDSMSPVSIGTAITEPGAKRMESISAALGLPLTADSRGAIPQDSRRGEYCLRTARETPEVDIGEASGARRVARPSADVLAVCWVSA